MRDLDEEFIDDIKEKEREVYSRLSAKNQPLILRAKSTQFTVGLGRDSEEGGTGEHGGGGGSEGDA